MEIERLLDHWTFDTYVIDDDVFTMSKEWIMKFAQLYPSHIRSKVQYEANLRVESVDKDMMRALKDTGCKLLKFGLENGDHTLRKKILKRPISDDQIIEVFMWAHDVGIPAHTFNIVGVPGETRTTMKKTVTLNRKSKPDRVQITLFFPYYGTPLGDEARAQGLVIEENESYFAGASVALPNLSQREIERYARWFKFKVYVTYRPLLAFNILTQKLMSKIHYEIKKRIFPRVNKPKPLSISPAQDIENSDCNFREVIS